MDCQAGSGRRNKGQVESSLSSHGSIWPAHHFAARLPQERVSARHRISGASLLFLRHAVLPRRTSSAAGLTGAHPGARLLAVWSCPCQLRVDSGHLLQRQVVLDSSASHGRLDLWSLCKPQPLRRPDGDAGSDSPGVVADQAGIQQDSRRRRRRGRASWWAPFFFPDRAAACSRLSPN